MSYFADDHQTLWRISGAGRSARGSGAKLDQDLIVPFEGGGTVVAGGHSAVFVPLTAVVLQEVAQHGDLGGQAVVGAVQAVGVLDQGNVLSIDPGIGLETVIGACDGENRLGDRHAEVVTVPSAA